MDEKKFVTLKEYCSSAGFSEWQIRMLIYREHQSGIARSGALLRLGGRWYVDADKMTEYMRDQAQAWARRQPSTDGPRRKEIKPPHSKVGA